MQSALFCPVGTPTQSAALADSRRRRRIALARRSRRARLLDGPRPVHFGMQAIGPSGERFIVLQMHLDDGDCWVTVRDLDEQTEHVVPLTSLH